MGVIIKDFGEVQPICNECGVCLCWSIDSDEYSTYKKFWDNWKCKECNPNYKNSYTIFKKEYDDRCC